MCDREGNTWLLRAVNVFVQLKRHSYKFMDGIEYVFELFAIVQKLKFIVTLLLEIESHRVPHFVDDALRQHLQLF